MSLSQQHIRIRTFLISIIVVSIGLHITSLWLGATILKDWRFANEPIHSAIEMAGSFTAFMVAYYLVVLERRKEGTSFNIPIAAALITMGILDGLHALLPPGAVFVWLHSNATFIGGLLFLFVWAPNSLIKKIQRRWIAITAFLTFSLGVLSMLNGHLLPKMMVDGQFTSTAVNLNVIGGTCLLLSAIRLILSYLKNQNVDDLLFCLHCLLFGAAAIMFEQSALWDLPWWGWHLLRFMAYAVALFFAIRTDLGLQKEIHEQTLIFKKEANNSNHLLAAIFQSAAHAIITLSDKGKILQYNQSAQAIFGYSKEEVVDSGVDILMPSQYKQKHKGYIDTYLRKGDSEVVGSVREMIGQSKSGRTFPMSISISEIKTEGGVIFTAIIQDISETKAIEADLIKVKEDAIAGAKAKSEFLAVMSHEIRTPMNGVLGMLGLLSKSKLDTEQTHRVSLAESSAKSLLSLINDILDFSKIDAGKLELDPHVFDLNKLISQIVEPLAYQAQFNKIEVVLDLIDLKENYVYGDSHRIRQIITNLMSNAVKFTENGDITVKLNLDDIDNKQWRLTVSIKDSGIGIPEEKLKYLFNQFTQADSSTTRKYGGTGLGLSIVKKLCAIMQGDIKVVSEHNQGSQFIFNIVVGKADQPTITIPKHDITNFNILLVDDNRVNLDVMESQLKIWGANVTTAQNAKQAIDIINSEQSFEIAILDMEMPKMNGVQLAEELRKNVNCQSMKLVMMTSLHNEYESTYFQEHGFNAYFTKPATSLDILSTLNLLIEQIKAGLVDAPFINKQYLEGFVDEEHNSQLRANILVVEDNAMNQLVISEQLEDLGLKYHIAENGAVAIEFLKNNTDIDLVLMDCQMPVMDGFEATKKIRDGKAGSMYHDITIIALTANAGEEDNKKCLGVGMNDFLTKPLAFEVLEERLRNWLK